MTKPNVVSAANGEELAGAVRQVSGKAAPANESASQVGRSSEASGEVRRGGPSGAIRIRHNNQFVTGNSMER